MDAGPRLKQAYYGADIAEFLTLGAQTVLGHLASHHPHDLDPLQRMAWLAQIALLQHELRGLSRGWIAFEFAIPRMGKRADLIILLDGVIFLIEFKIGADQFTAAAIDQVIDYALDLKNFHTGSHARPIVPVIIATNAVTRPSQLPLWPDDVAQPVLTNGKGLANALQMMLGRYPHQPPLDPQAWMMSDYKPTPTIIQAAQALYGSHRVEDITRFDAGKQNLGITTGRIAEIIEAAKRGREKIICFVTGVPGAGKTLAGLNLVTGRTNAHKDEHAVFLSGNGPLVSVLREALARDETSRLGVSIVDARRKVTSFIQNIHNFRDDKLRNDNAPIEHVVVFDEAQRAWNIRKISRFMREKHGIADFGQSEPAFLISVMDRHADWCVIVCLVGGGQEINDGEAGLSEWFHALKQSFRDWKVVTSDCLDNSVYTWGQDLRQMLAGLDARTDPDLHLAVSIRSFRAEKLSDFVNDMIAGRPDRARAIHEKIKDSYPIHLTRDLAQARQWLRQRARGSERFGLVASSGASRLKPDGVNVHEKIEAANWFLNAKTDVRSSFYLEDPATEFDIQGLELDWTAVCWDADLRWADGNWSYHRFQGTRWLHLKDQALRNYLANAYRVLLTRARQGMVIYVPSGDAADATRQPQFYEGIAAYLEDCGIPILTPPAGPVREIPLGSRQQ